MHSQSLFVLVELFVLCHFISDSFGMEIRDFSIPSYITIGSSAQLKCFYEPGASGKLVNLKWYVNGTEFYRFEPGSRKANPVKIFQIRGVQVNEQQTRNYKKVGSLLVLDNVSVQTSGFYKCEITAEPLFFTAEKEAEMRVVSLAEYMMESVYHSRDSAANALHTIRWKCRGLVWIAMIVVLISNRFI